MQGEASGSEHREEQGEAIPRFAMNSETRLEECRLRAAIADAGALASSGAETRAEA